MQLDLTRYRQPESSFARTLRPDELGEDHDAYRVAAPVELAFTIYKDKNRFRLAGTVKTTLELPCSRCLEPFELPIDAPFDVRYLPIAEAETADEREVAPDDLETNYYRDDQIDLSELAREQFYLALPMKPLCQDDCRGLCSQCGTNLNSSTCGCSPVWENPQLAPLRALGKLRES